MKLALSKQNYFFQAMQFTYNFPHSFIFCLIQTSFILFQRLKDVQTLEELGDVYNHFLLYYGRDIPKMQNAAKANKKRLKKIREVSEDGKLNVIKIFWT